MAVKLLSAQKYTTRNFNNSVDPLDDPTNPRFLLKCAASNTFTDVSGNGWTVTNTGSVTNSTATAKFSSTSSASFSGTNSLSIADNVKLRPGTGSFTLEFWWYPTSLTGYRTPFGKGYTAAGDLVLQTGNGDGRLVFYSSATILTSTIAVTANAWNHVALVRNGTAMALYIGGVSAATATSAVDLNGTNPIYLGIQTQAGVGAVGFIQDVRYFVGFAQYTAAFTPPGSLS